MAYLFVKNVPGIVFTILYSLMMVYGMASLGSYWSNIGLRSQNMQEIPDAWFAIFGLAVPFAGCMLCIWTPMAFFVAPGGLGLLYAMTSAREARAGEVLDAMRQEDLARVEDMLKLDEGNAAAHWGRAQACERAGAFEDALASYRRAHELCSKTVSADELREIESRLGDAILAAARSRDGRCAASQAAALDRPPHQRLRAVEMTRLLLWAGAAMAVWNWSWGLNIMSMMLFLRWLNGKRA